MLKSMIAPIYAWCLALIFVIWSISFKAQSSDSFVLNPTELDVIVAFDGTRSRNGTVSRESEWEAGVRFGQTGYLLDPKIAWFLVDIEPIIRRSDFDSEITRQETEGELLNYLFQVNLLRGTPGPFGLDLSTQRSDNFNTGSLGNRFDTVTDTNKVSLRWKNPAFPTSLTYQQSTLDEEFRSSLSSTATERDEILESWILKGRSSKLNVHLEHTELDDRIAQRDQDYELDRAIVSHNFLWGLNSKLHSNINFYDREGFNANERFTLDENIRIQHLENLYSHTSYNYQSTKQTIESKEQGLNFGLHHRLHKNLNSNVFVNLNKREADNSDEDKWHIGAGTQYNKSNLYGANVGAGVRASYQETDRISKLGLFDVVDESQVVPLNGIVVLDLRFIFTASIVVTDTTGTIVYNDGSDYTIAGIAGDFTQLQIVPGGRIDTGETILISYQAEQLPSQKFSTTFTNYNLSLDFDWFRLTHSDSKSDDSFISGANESFLQDTRNTFTEIDFHFNPAGIDTHIGAERRFTMTGDLESTQYSFRQQFSWTTAKSRKSRGIIWNINAIQSYTEQDQIDTDLYRIDFSANWRPTPNLTVRPSISLWKRTDEGSVVAGVRREDEFATAGIWVRYRYRKVDLDFSYHHDERSVTHLQDIDDTELTEDRVMLTLKRRIM